MLTKRVSGLLALIVAFVMSSSLTAQEQTRFVLKLNDDLVNNLKNFGTLSSGVEEKFRNRISMIELQYENFVVSRPTSNAQDVAINMENDVANISIDDDMIDLLQNGPLRITVPDDKRSFSKISLNYELTPKPAKVDSGTQANSSEPILNDSGQPMDTFFIRMSKSESMSGGIDGLESIKLNTRFGGVSIPMDQIAGVKFHVDNKDAAVVILNNGDSITGTPEIPAISLKTDWGVADVEPKFIDALTTTANAKFQQVATDFGLRWELKTGDSFAPGPARTVDGLQ